MADWFYEEGGAHRGPVSEADLRTLLSNGFVPPDTRVWTQAFGEQWRPASQTDLATSFRPAGPPPLGAAPAAPPPFGYPTSPPPFNAPYAPPFGAPGPMPGTVAGAPAAATKPSPTYARLIAFYPLFLMAVEIAFGLANKNPNLPPVSTGIAFWSAVIILGFARGDAKAIERAGLNPTGKWIVPFMFLTPVGYFIRRKVVAGVSLAPLWIWLGCGVIYVVVSAALFT